jgi:hypothetical protein
MQIKKIAIFLLGLILMFNGVKAQLDERYEEPSSEESVAAAGSVSVLKLKKSYVLGEGITIKSANGSINLNQSLQTSFLMNTSNSNFTRMSSTFNINRARFSFAANLFDPRFSIYGRLNLPADYQSATGGTRSFNTVLQEAFVEYKPSIAHAFNFGLRADYIDSRETRIEGESLGFINRSAVSGAFDAIFDFGLRYKGNYKLGGKHLLKPYASITTGDSRSSLQKNYGGFKYGIRLDYLPFGKFSKGGESYMDDLAREQKPKLVAGFIYSFNNGISSNIGTNGGRYLYRDSSKNIVLPDYSKSGFDFLFKYKGFYAMGSYFITTAHVPDGVTEKFSLTRNDYIKYDTAITSSQIKDDIKSKLNIGNGFNIQGGYTFPSNWAVACRYATLNEEGVSNNFADYNKSYTLVFTKYLSGNNLKIQTEFGFDEFKSSLKTATQKGNYYSQIMVTVQL